MKKGIALMSMLIIGIVLFVSAAIIRDALGSRSLDPVIGNTQSLVLMAAQEIDANKEFVEAQVRKDSWNALRSSFSYPQKANEHCPSYYGRIMYTQSCSILNDKAIGENIEASSMRPKVFVESSQEALHAFASTGEYQAIDKKIEAKKAVYEIKMGGFIDVDALLRLPSLEKALQKIREQAAFCLEASCIVPVSTDLWNIESVDPKEGFSAYNGFVVQLNEEIKKCGEITQDSCWCPFSYDPATKSGDAEFNAVFAKKQGYVFKGDAASTVVTDADGFSFTLPKQVVVRTQSNGIISEKVAYESLMVRPPTAVMPQAILNAPEGKDEFSIHSGFLIDDKRMVVLQSSIDKSSIPGCAQENHRIMLKLISKKLYPPDATPLVFYVAFDLSPEV